LADGHRGFEPAGGADYWDYGLNTSLRTFLNDPSGFLKYRFGVRGWVSFYPWTGASLVTGLEAYPFNTVSTSNAPSETAVRTDIVPYQQNNVVLGILMAEQIEKFPHEIYGRLSAGILEVQYAGLDGEVAMPLFGGRLMVGLSGSVVKKRDQIRSSVQENDFRTAIGRASQHAPEPAEVGRRRSEDRTVSGGRPGTRITLSKFFSSVICRPGTSVQYGPLHGPLQPGLPTRGCARSMRLFKGGYEDVAGGISLDARCGSGYGHFNSLFSSSGGMQIYLKKDAASRDGRNAGL
jgi:hypothetical protein